MKLTLAFTRGILKKPGMRRWAMFYLVLAAAVLLFFGATFFSGWLTDRPAVFVLYWIVCAWLTMTAVLLAIFDILIIRAQVRAATRHLRTEVFGNEDDRTKKE